MRGLYIFLVFFLSLVLMVNLYSFWNDTREKKKEIALEGFVFDKEKIKNDSITQNLRANDPILLDTIENPLIVIARQLYSDFAIEIEGTDYFCENSKIKIAFFNLSHLNGGHIGAYFLFENTDQKPKYLGQKGYFAYKPEKNDRLCIDFNEDGKKELLLFLSTDAEEYTTIVYQVEDNKLNLLFEQTQHEGQDGENQGFFASFWKQEEGILLLQNKENTPLDFDKEKNQELFSLNLKDYYPFTEKVKNELQNFCHQLLYYQHKSIDLKDCFFRGFMLAAPVEILQLQEQKFVPVTSFFGEHISWRIDILKDIHQNFQAMYERSFPYLEGLIGYWEEKLKEEMIAQVDCCSSDED